MQKQRLDALTGLRFFAAFAIVVHHEAGILVPESSVSWVPLDQAVSLFFVLSGFILTYTYPELPMLRRVLDFWRARVARLWPVHFFALLVVIFFVGGSDRDFGLPLLANLLMIYAWIPDNHFAFSFRS